MTEVWKEILELETQLNEGQLEFEEKIELKDRILTLKRENGLIKPPDSPYECEGCSA